MFATGKVLPLFALPCLAVALLGIVCSRHAQAQLIAQEEVQCSCNPYQPTDQKNTDDLDLLEKNLYNGKAHLIDATFLYEAKSSQGAITVEGVNVNAAVPDQARQAQVLALLNATSGHANPRQFGLLSFQFPVATSFQSAMSILAAQKNNLSFNQKVLYLSMLASALSNGYNPNLVNTTMNGVFSNLKNGGTQGGICGDIHQYLANSATALGLTDAGITYVNWKSDGSAHFAMHFRDPKTGEYYIANYSQIYATDTKTLADATEVATRLLAPLTGAAPVEGNPGVYHMYIPKTAMWVGDQLDKAMVIQANDPMIRFVAGNDQTSFLFQTTGSENVKGFVMHSDRTEADGKYSLDAIGVSADWKNAKANLLDGTIDELTYEAKVKFGADSVSVPQISTNGLASKNWSQDSLFAGFDLKGTARINDVTGQLEVSGQTIDFSSNLHSTVMGSVQSQIHVGAEYREPVTDWP